LCVLLAVALATLAGTLYWQCETVRLEPYVIDTEQTQDRSRQCFLPAAVLLVGLLTYLCIRLLQVLGHLRFAWLCVPTGFVSFGALVSLFSVLMLEYLMIDTGWKTEYGPLWSGATVSYAVAGFLAFCGIALWSASMDASGQGGASPGA
jgi:hypothetical protein